MNKKAQGLPMSVIAIAIIVILTLVLVILFITGTLPNLFAKTRIVGEELGAEENTTFRLACEQACFSAQQLADNLDEWKLSEYCTKRLKGFKCSDVGVYCVSPKNSSWNHTTCR
ncbi:MAG: hypothetical protein QXQ79_00380 [Candidatus Nanoarchaeia archaeon]